MKRIFLSLPTLLVAATLVHAQAMPPPGGPPGGPGPGGPPIERLVKALALSDAQTTQVKAILEAQRAKMDAERAQADADLHQQLSSVLSAEQLRKFDELRQRRPQGMNPGPPPGRPGSP